MHIYQSYITTSNLVKNLFAKIIFYITYILNNITGYSDGMVDYIELNEISVSKQVVINSNRQGLLDEVCELWCEVIDFNLYNAMLELFDIYHSCMILLVFQIVPQKYWTNSKLWYLIWFVGGIVSPIKHGERYINEECIRNSNHCSKNNHKCHSKHNKKLE